MLIFGAVNHICIFINTPFQSQNLNHFECVFTNYLQYTNAKHNRKVLIRVDLNTAINYLSKNQAGSKSNFYCVPEMKSNLKA